MQLLHGAQVLRGGNPFMGWDLRVLLEGADK